MEQPTGFELLINGGAANLLGLTIPLSAPTEKARPSVPPSVLMLADKVTGGLERVRAT